MRVACIGSGRREVQSSLVRVGLGRIDVDFVAQLSMGGRLASINA